MAALAPAAAPAAAAGKEEKEKKGGEIYLLTGGTGKTGTALVALLASDMRRPTIRVATRDVKSNDCALLKTFGVEGQVVPVLFDVDSKESMGAALAGVTKLMVIPPFVPDMDVWHEKVAAAAKEAGVKYIVKVSVTGARGPSSAPPPGRIPLMHWRGEEALRKTGIPTTCIRPTIFMQHFGMSAGMYTRGENKFYLPTSNIGVAWVDCRDIATLAHRLFSMTPAERKQYEGQSYELTGPQSITAGQIGDMLSWVAERKIEHVDGEEAFIAHCRAVQAQDMVKFIYAEARGGHFGKVDNEAYQKIVGHDTTTFGKFAEDIKYFFYPNNAPAAAAGAGAAAPRA